MAEPVIWKFPINLRGANIMPRGAKLLDFHEQNDEPWVWALVDPKAERVDRYLIVAATGGRCPDDLPYVGTAHLANDGLVLHLFDGGESR